MSYQLSDHVRQEIEHWKASVSRKIGSARLSSVRCMHAVQHENHGYLTAEQMNAVADYLELPAIQVYEVATFYSMFQT